MMIRVVLRSIPLFLVAIFALSVLITGGPAERARHMARVDGHRLAWTQSQVKCPEPWGNLPISGCTRGNTPIKPPSAH
ncbi:hypothetical protein [Paracoccus ravus]|uniref:hypothetical protein n=1 Tax=Paracoccus ravus TaxID=2447760 RepID=UPI00106E04E2|nr:hypothetical protein [Paracoccus ravus]